METRINSGASDIEPKKVEPAIRSKMVKLLINQMLEMFLSFTRTLPLELVTDIPNLTVNKSSDVIIIVRLECELKEEGIQMNNKNKKSILSSNI